MLKIIAIPQEVLEIPVAPTGSPEETNTLTGILRQLSCHTVALILLHYSYCIKIVVFFKTIQRSCFSLSP
jgi:hypothetical protein